MPAAGNLPGASGVITQTVNVFTGNITETDTDPSGSFFYDIQVTPAYNQIQSDTTGADNSYIGSSIYISDTIVQSNPNTTAMMEANVLQLFPPFTNTFNPNTYWADYTVSWGETGVEITRLQYKFKINSELSSTVTWDVKFTPQDGSTPLHDIHVWTGSHVTETPVFTVNPAVIHNGVPGFYEVIPLKVEYVYETQKGNHYFQSLATLPIFQPGSGTSTVSYASTYDFYQVQLTQELSTAAAATMTVNFSNSSGSFTGTLTETAPNSGIFHDGANVLTLTLPVGTATSNSGIDLLPATVTCPSLGLSNAAITLQESDSDSLNFLKPQLDIAVMFPANGLSSTTPDTITLEYASDIVHDVVLTETAANSKVFNSSDGSTSVSIVGTPAFNPNAVDDMQVQLTTNLLPGPATYQVIETGATTNVFSNFSVTSTPVVAVNPTTDDDGVIYAQVDGLYLAPDETMPLTMQVGSNTLDLSLSCSLGGPAMTDKILLAAPGSSVSYAGLHVLTMDSFASRIFAMIDNNSTPSASTQGYAPAFLSVGYIPPDQLSTAKIDPKAHLQALDAIIGKKVPANQPPPLLGYSNSQIIPALDQGTLFSNLPNYSIFYIMGHSQGIHPDIGSDTFDGFLVWNNDPNDKSTDLHVAGMDTGINLSKTPAGQVLITPTFIQGVLDNARGQNIDVQPYNLVFINGCASTCPNSDNGSGDVPDAYVNAFKAKAYVGWPLSVTLESAAKEASIFFTKLGGQKKVSEIVRDRLNPIQADEVPTDSQIKEGIKISLLQGATLPKVTLEELGTDPDVIIDNTQANQ